MEQILQAYDLPIEISAAVMMLYKNTKVKVRSPDVDIVADVLQGGYISPIFVHNLIRLRTLKGNRSNKRQ